MTGPTAPASQAMRSTRPRTPWNELPNTVRRAIESAAGTVHAAEPISAGLNCGIAALLHTPTGRVFIKGLPSNHPRITTQQREAEINSHVAPIAPRLLWQVDLDGWNILAFEHLDGRHANLAPGSPDLPKIADTLTRLGQIPAPELPLRRLQDRWADLADDSTLTLLAASSCCTPTSTPTTSSSASTRTSSTGPGPPSAPPGSTRPAPSCDSSPKATPPQPPKPGQPVSRHGHHVPTRDRRLHHD